MEERTPRRGDLWWLERDEKKDRVVVILSPDVMNRNSERCIVGLCTTKHMGTIYESEVDLSSLETPKPCKLQCDQVHTVLQSRLRDYVTEFTSDLIGEMNQAICAGLGVPLYFDELEF